MLRATLFSALTLAVVFLFQAVAPADLHAEKHEQLYGLLKDVKGWKGEDPEGMEMDMMGMKMVQAMRTYKKGDNEISAMITIGQGSMAGAYGGQGEMKYESSEGKLEMKEIDGFPVHLLFEKDDETGSITVVLTPEKDKGAVFILTFEGIKEEEGMKIAKSFDWKAMKKKVEELQ